MSGASRGPVFDDFGSADEVAAALQGDLPSRIRETLVVWEYVWLRADRRGMPRPVQMDAGFVAGRLYEARHPLAIVNRVIRLAAVAGFAAYVVISSAARSNDIPVVFGIVGLGAVLLITWSWLSDLLGPSGRAMRLVWQARNLPASDRRALLMAAADLDPKSGGASVHGQA